MNKIAFFSTSSRPAKSLESLSKHFDICFIVTKTDKFIGRDKEKTQNEIKKFAVKNNIPLFEIDKLNSETKLLLKNELEKNAPDLAVTFDFGFIVPKDLFDIPKYKFVNIHFSLLPKHRGASAVQFAILNDEKIYGITYHLIDATLDTGDILYQSIYPLDENFNSEQAYTYLFDKSAEEICGVLTDYLKGNLTPVPQDISRASYTYSKTNPKHTFIFKEDAIISDLSDERKLFRQIKAYYPWPKVQMQASDLLKLEQFKGLEMKEVNSNPVIKINNAIFKERNINITEVTVQNGKNLKVNDFINGYFKKA